MISALQCPTCRRLSQLKAFIAFLKDSCNFDFNIDSFEDRTRLQKYVFFAGHFGWQHPYEYDIYCRGPYSTKLAEDYYRLYEKGGRQ